MLFVECWIVGRRDDIIAFLIWFLVIYDGHLLRLHHARGVVPSCSVYVVYLFIEVVEWGMTKLNTRHFVALIILNFDKWFGWFKYLAMLSELTVHSNSAIEMQPDEMIEISISSSSFLWNSIGGDGRNCGPKLYVWQWELNGLPECMEELDSNSDLTRINLTCSRVSKIWLNLFG